MDTWKSAVDQQLEALMSHFPIPNIDTAIAFLEEQLSLNDADSVSFPAVCFFLNVLAEASTVERKSTKRKSTLDGPHPSSVAQPESVSERNPITWTVFSQPWRALRREITENVGLLEALEQSKSSPDYTKRVVKAIFRFIEDNIAVSKDVQTSSVSPLSRFIARLDEVEMKGKDMTISTAEQKALVVLIAHLVGLENVHLSLSESEVFVRDEDRPDASVGSSEFVDVAPTTLAPFLIPRTNSGTELLPNNLWTYSGGHYVHCDVFAEIAYVVCRSYKHDHNKPEMKKVQFSVLECLHNKGHLKRYPAALVVLAQLQKVRKDFHRADELFREAIAVSRELYDDAFVLPYCRFAQFLMGHPKDYVLALVPAVLAARAISVYHYIPSLDHDIHDEIIRMADLFAEICQKFHNDKRPADPLVAPLLLSFLDYICLWEQKNQSNIFHSTWSQKLVSLMNPSKLGVDMFRSVMLHGSAQSVARVLNHETFIEDDDSYLDYMLDTFRQNKSSSRKENVLTDNDTVKLTEQKYDFPPNIEVNEEFCRFALNLYENWAPLRLDRTFVSSDKALYFEIPEDEKSIEYAEVMKQLSKFPVRRGVSDEDLDKIAPLRAVNPLYKLANKQVFPFLDMGPSNIAICSFDYEKVKREVKTPLPAYEESRVVYALQRKLNELAGKGEGEASKRHFSHVVLRSIKMQSVKTMLSGDRVALPEIKQVLEGSAISASNTQKRERRPTFRRQFC
ncbi:hypothetical protein RvY_02597 [Ramazzottius varieornatus]|uniref:Menin n=1 Tax=Ramazzottius varieornatus TaxID=947166 RepID=A0A1D1UUT7_RAMVA|nr:hypothetical protein RvY_02597 [Ramazzottius varieornatus]